MTTTTLLRPAPLLLLVALASGCSASSTGAPPATGTTLATTAAPDPAAPRTDADRDLHLEGALNARDLAGLRGAHGPIPPDRLLRTADLSRATAADKDVLARHDVKLDLDLRTPGEVARRPDAIAGDPRFHYENVSLVGSEETDVASITSLGDWYIGMLARKQPEFRQTFQRIAAQKDGAVLVHCTAGKDRTGMVVAILLDLAGVDRATIAQNYALSAKNIESMARPLIEKDPKLTVVLGSPPADMMRFLEVLDTQYGGGRGYLHMIGVSDADIEALSKRLGQ
jgi:protein-tyrosine phosphatase